MVGAIGEELTVLALFEPGAQSGPAAAAADKFVKALKRERERLFLHSVHTW